MTMTVMGCTVWLRDRTTVDRLGIPRLWIALSGRLSDFFYRARDGRSLGNIWECGERPFRELLVAGCCEVWSYSVSHT